MQKRIYDVKPYRELFSYDYDATRIFILEKLTTEEGSRAAVVRQIVAYWPNEKEWVWSGSGSEHSHADNLVYIRQIDLTPLGWDKAG